MLARAFPRAPKFTALRYAMRGGQEATISQFNPQTGTYRGYVLSAGFTARLRQPCQWDAQGVAMSRNRDLDLIS